MSREADRGEGAGEGEHGPRVLAWGPSKVTRGLEGPGHSPTLNELWCPDRPEWWPGGMVSLVLWFGGLQSPALWFQAPGEGPLRTDLELGLDNRRLTGLS